MRNPHDDNDNVLRYLTSFGLRVFPLPRGKRIPRIKAFHDVATTDPDFSLAANNAAVATGDGFAVIDVDVKGGRDGRPAFESLGPLPVTLTVRTPTGGMHYYFALPPGAEVGNSVNRIGTGVDVRGTHGYVVAPGSITEKGTYTIIRRPDGDRLPLLPDHVIRRCRAPREKDGSTPAIELDLPENVAAAAEWLTTSAPEAHENSGDGDNTTFQVAARVKDFGVSEPTALELLSGYWNENKAFPPWAPDDLARKVANAYSYGTSAPGAKAPAAEFSEALAPEQLAAIEASRLLHSKPPHEHQPDTTPLTGLAAHLHPLTPFDLARDLKPRRFILGHILARGVVSALIAPPGVGKTTLALEMAVVTASGKPILGHRFRPIGGPKHVLLWCQEDDQNELNLRLAAIMRHFGLTWDDFHDPVAGTSRLHILSGAERPLQIAVTASDNRSLAASQDASDVLAYMQRHEIALAVFDPLAELHPGDENDNGHMGKVARTFRTIAVRADANVMLVHHTKKHDMASSDDFAGDMWSGRGAGAVMGVARYAATMFTVGERCAKHYGIGDDERHRYIRFDDAKNNLGPMSGDPAFLERVSVTLPEIGTEVGVLVPVERKARERVVSEVPVDVFAADVRYVVEQATGEGARAIGWQLIIEMLQADRYEGGSDGSAEAGRYGLSGADALRKRGQRLFDNETGEPLARELDGLVLRKKGNIAYVGKREGA